MEDITQPEDELNWEPLIDREDKANIGISPAVRADDTPKLLNLPFTCYAVSLPPKPTADELHRLYLSLYTMAVTATRQHCGPFLDGATLPGKLHTQGDAVISYNLAMTTSRMVICPRRSEFALIPVDSTYTNGSIDEGVVKLNGTILAGTLMVKTLAEWNALRSQPSILETVLKTVGIPNTTTT